MPEQFPDQAATQATPPLALDQEAWQQVAAEYKNWHEGLHPHVENQLKQRGLGHLVQGTDANTDMPEVGSDSNSVGEEDDATWGYTIDAEELAKIRQDAERAAGRPERKTIGRDTPIMEGVYEGAYGGEAIVVDYNFDPGLINEATEKVLNVARDPDTGVVDKTKILNGVFDLVSDTMKYDAKQVEDIFKLAGAKDGTKIPLGVYIKIGFGVCRHQALYVGELLENLKNQGYILGRASVDRNAMRRPDDKYDGHAWVRYTNSAGEVYIVDVAQQKIGTLEEMMAAYAQDPVNNWDYARPEDKVSNSTEAVQVIAKQSPYDESTYTNADGVIDRVPWDTSESRQTDQNKLEDSQA